MSNAKDTFNHIVVYTELAGEKRAMPAPVTDREGNYLHASMEKAEAALDWQQKRNGPEYKFEIFTLIPRK